MRPTTSPMNKIRIASITLEDPFLSDRLYKLVWSLTALRSERFTYLTAVQKFNGSLCQKPYPIEGVSKVDYRWFLA
ncbi:MAG: hypothetical protein NZ937_01285 [Armatimonadetes bacterium]|nr:hypothetical protein [Armatimonadota bacterium]